MVLVLLADVEGKDEALVLVYCSAGKQASYVPIHDVDKLLRFIRAQKVAEMFSESNRVRFENFTRGVQSLYGERLVEKSLVLMLVYSRFEEKHVEQLICFYYLVCFPVVEDHILGQKKRFLLRRNHLRLIHECLDPAVLVFLRSHQLQLVLHEELLGLIEANSS